VARLPPGSRPAGQVIEIGYRDVLGDLKAKLRLNPRVGVHQQLKLPVSKTPGVPLLHTKILSWMNSVITYPDSTKQLASICE